MCTLMGEVFGNAILSDILHDSATNEEMEAAMMKSYPFTISYHDVGEHYQHQRRFIADIVQHRVNHSGDVVAVIEADVSDS
jgi:hypothetical protein